MHLCCSCSAFTHGVSVSEPGRAQHHEPRSPVCAGPSCTGLGLRIPAAQVGWGWDRRVARVRDWGLGGTSQVYFDSKHKALKHAQIERQTLCHKNAASVACGCFKAHTVLVLHADPFDSTHFNRQRTYGKNHTKSDDR